MSLREHFSAVIFDCDGTLVDSETLGNSVLVQFVAEHGLRVELNEALELFRGAKLADSVAILEQRLGRPLPGSFIPELRLRMADAFRRQLQPIDGALELVAQCRLEKCVASSGPLDKVRLSLELTGLLRFFEERIFSSYDIKSWKPEPHLFLHAARQLKAAPADCCVVEDSILGVQAALAAGMSVVAFQPFGRHPDIPSSVPSVSHLTEVQAFLTTATAVPPAATE